MRTLKWAIFNAGFLCLAYYAVTIGDGWQFNLFRFAVWVNFLGTMVCALNKEAIGQCRKNGPPAPKCASICVDVIMILFLICNGWFFTSVLVIIQGLGERVIYYGTDDKGEK